MNSLGYGISYSELRMFLSSAAEHAIKTQCITETGGLVPDNITHKRDGGQLVVGVADNWDHNEKTTDGKGTTHAMTSILVSPKVSADRQIPRLQRSTNRSFDKNCVPGGSLCSITPYRKPINRPCPTFEPVVSLEEVNPTVTPAVTQSRLKELLYSFGRCSVFCDDISERSIYPPWDGFHAKTMFDATASVSNVAFNPIIMATPTDYSTIYTVLLRLKECMNALGQQYAPVIFDMSLLAKALEIVWCNRDELQGVIPCEGGMHLLMSVFAGIGYLYGDAGLRHLLSESGVYAAGTVNNILTGKDFDRALTAFKIIDEALNSRLLTNFEAWCIENDIDLDEDLGMALRNIKDINSMTVTEKDIWGNIATTKLLPLLEEFRTESRQISPIFKLWDEYLTRVSEPLKLFISSTREPDWTVHKYSKLCLLPLLFASNRTSYAKNMTVQVLNMNRLPREAEDGFLQGLFTAKLSSGKFNNVWLDYTLEATENKALKGTGGIIGLTMKDGALARWFLSRPLASRYSTMFHNNVCHKNEKDGTHHADTKAKRENYDRNVNKMVSMFDSSFVDPFNTKKAPERLVNFATCQQSTDEIELNMLSCIDKGEEMLKAFVSERLKANQKAQTRQ
ncbi:uncharacterized protein LOC128232273 [Mya arenaria]|uniref:uncharacterized protein LOC128232273 n=1 Tax=Mya arenaria TaxID=6604 RepID=UPI0022E1CFAA|nr:uncharacterized protein LOC128232273 [Mya arenaria]